MLPRLLDDSDDDDDDDDDRKIDAEDNGDDVKTTKHISKKKLPKPATLSYASTY